MSSTLQERYLAHYTPLVREFVLEMQALQLDIQPDIPAPFFPLFGEAYERSSLRIAIVGQDTRGWTCLKNFLEAEATVPGSALQQTLKSFQGGRERMPFWTWGNTRYTFWGFAMMFLAALHGRSDWSVLKSGACTEILSSFVWGNGNAIEYHGSSEKFMPPDHWEKVRQCGRRFDGIQHLLKTVRPKVVVVLWKGMNPETYFDGYEYVEKEESDEIRSYCIPSENVDVFHVPHPGRMRWESVSADHFCSHLVTRLHQRKLLTTFPTFIQPDEDSDEVLQHLKNTAPPLETSFEFVAWVAEELKKRESFMSVSTLASLLNDLGYRTVYNTAYAGGRGTYTLIRHTYNRLQHAEENRRAQTVAEAFRKADFTYAYKG